VEWAKLQGLMIIRKNNNWSSWEEIYSLFNYVKSELTMEPISVRIINLTKDTMTLELFGVYRADMYDSLISRLNEIANNLRKLYTVELTWITGG